MHEAYESCIEGTLLLIGGIGCRRRRPGWNLGEPVVKGVVVDVYGIYCRGTHGGRDIALAIYRIALQGHVRRLWKAPWQFRKFLVRRDRGEGRWGKEGRRSAFSPSKFALKREKCVFACTVAGTSIRTVIHELRGETAMAVAALMALRGVEE